MPRLSPPRSAGVLWAAGGGSVPAAATGPGAALGPGRVPRGLGVRTPQDGVGGDDDILGDAMFGWALRVSCLARTPPPRWEQPLAAFPRPPGGLWVPSLCAPPLLLPPPR